MTRAEALQSEKLRSLLANLAQLKSLVVAFSGGVDSTFLLQAASLTPGLRYLAITTDSPTNTREEVDEARALAEQIGAPHRVIAVNELDTPGYAENPANRCYLCKQTLYPVCFEHARQEGLTYVADGVNTDDLGDYRPGLTAAAEMGVLHPLVDAQLGKAEIRMLSAAFGLPTASRPASPCLSSRFPYGTRIARESLEQVAAAEKALKELGFIELRVRFLGQQARVEVAEAEFAKLSEPALRRRAEQGVRAAGFTTVEFSDQPLRSGSLNDVLRERSASLPLAEDRPPSSP